MKTVAYRKMVSEIYQSLNPSNLQMSPYLKRSLYIRNSVKDFEMWRLSWISWVGPKQHHKCPYKMKAEGDYLHRSGGPMTMETQIAVMWP